MATLTSAQGLVDDGSGNLVVQGTTTVNAEVMAVNVLTGSNFCVLPAAGFFQVPVTGTSGQGSFTGSLPAPASNTGGTIMITDSSGIYPYLITGSIAMMTGSTISGGGNSLRSINGTKLTVTQGGSVGFWSDGKGWLVCAVSGTMTLA